MTAAAADDAAGQPWPEETVTLAVLAGGAGSRMGGPKDLLQLHGRPILDHLLDRLRWSGPTLLVSAPDRPHPIGWRQFDRVVADAVPGEGPLRGVLTALEAITTDGLLVLPIDMPRLDRRPLERLLDELRQRPDARGVAFQRVIDGHLRPQPLPAAFRADSGRTADVIRGHLTRGQRSLHRLLREEGFALLDAPADLPPETWLNLNDPADAAACGVTVLPGGGTTARS